MISFDYSSAYDPPAPVVSLTLVTAAEGREIGPLEALVDSGADGTIVPISPLLQIHASATGEGTVRGPWDQARNVVLYLVDIRIGTITVRGVEVVGDRQGVEIILGRDVLNQLRVLLDGLGEAVEVSR